MVEKFLIIKSKGENTCSYYDYDERSFGAFDEVLSADGSIELDKIFGVSEQLNVVKGITVVYCEESDAGECHVGAVFRNAEIYRYSQYYDPYLFDYGIVSSSDDVYALPSGNLDYAVEFDGRYTYKEDEELERYIRTICIEENCIRFDDAIVDNGLVQAGEDVKKLGELFDEVFGRRFQTRKAAPIAERLHKLSDSVDDTNRYINFLRHSNKPRQALSIATECHDKYKNDCTLVHMAMCNYEMGFNTEAMSLLDRVSDKQVIAKMNVDYDYLKKMMPYISNSEHINERDVLKYSVALPFKEMPLPEVIKVDGIKKYYDPVRKKGVPITPEEKVRQQVLRYLIDVCRIPEDYITSEDSLAHYDRGNIKRADITVYADCKTLLLVECKENGTGIDGAPLHQILDYNKTLRSKYLLLTNGLSSYIYRCEADGNVTPLSALPNFGEMCRSAGSVVNINKLVTKRPDVAEFTSEVVETYRNDGRFIGRDTPEDIARLSLNLGWMFLDSEHKIEGAEGYGCKIIRDLGAINTVLSNASGGKFDGQYRQLLVSDRFGNEQLVCFSVFGVISGYTSLVCGIEIRGRLTAKLEMRMDVCAAKQYDGSYVITHNGARSRKKNRSTIDYVSEQCPYLVSGERIFLGCFDNDKNIIADDPGTKDFMMRLISYLILRKELSLKEEKQGK